VRIWDLTAGAKGAVLPGHGGWVLAVGFTADGRSLISRGNDGLVRVWEVSTGRLLASYEKRSQSVVSAYAPAGQLVALADLDGGIEVGEIQPEGRRIRLEGHARGVASLCFAPDGLTLASGGYDGAVRLWDATTGRAIATYRGHDGWVFALGFSPDPAEPRLLASGGEDATVRFWQVATGREFLILRGHDGYVHAVTFSPDGLTVASGARDTTIRIWSLDDLRGSRRDL
jgi:WD40 repeat protein